MYIIKNNKGFTLVEVLIAVLLSGLVLTSGYKFYSAAQSQTTIQMELSKIQNMARSSLDDIKRTLRQAGYKLTSHDPYLINGDSMMVFFNVHNPVDTVSYFLTDPSTVNGTMNIDGYDIGLPQKIDNTTYCLVKSCSFGTASVYSDNIVSLKFLKLKENVIRITITTQSEYPDEAYNLNNGYRRWTLSEEVCLRNI
ncbi:PilW family protein [Candidatus Zixiibacteriota bacterium]